ncbi:MAG: hypothetical protein ACYCPM_07865, partial [Acidobacteriaceae bacterium]
ERGVFSPLPLPVGTVRRGGSSQVKRPGKKASPEQQKQYKTAVKQKNLSRNFVQMGMQLRADLDQARRESSLCG